MEAKPFLEKGLTDLKQLQTESRLFPSHLSLEDLSTIFLSLFDNKPVLPFMQNSMEVILEKVFIGNALVFTIQRNYNTNYLWLEGLIKRNFSVRVCIYKDFAQETIYVRSPLNYQKLIPVVDELQTEFVLSKTIKSMIFSQDFEVDKQSIWESGQFHQKRKNNRKFVSDEDFKWRLYFEYNHQTRMWEAEYDIVNY